MAINITLEKKDLWIFSAILVFLLGVVYVIAIGEDYTVHGHDHNEINLPVCDGGQVLKYNGVVWGCANDIDTDTNTVSGLVTGWVVTGDGVCSSTWGTGNCGGGYASCDSGHTLRKTGDRDGGGGFYLCIRN